MMKFEKDDIIIRKGILHILDCSSGYLGLSESLLDMGPDLLDFIRTHLFRILEGDDTSMTIMNKCHSDVAKRLSNFNESDDNAFIDETRKISEAMFDIMCDSVQIPSADLLCISFQLESQIHLALLKMNYKEIFTHKQAENEVNEVIKQRILPQESSHLTEAVIMNLQTKDVYILQKKYEMLNGDKINYLSERFLMCNADLTPKKKFQILNATVNDLLNQKTHENIKDYVEKKVDLYNMVRDSQKFDINQISDELFGQDVESKQQFDEKMEHYDLQYDKFDIKKESTAKKLSMIHLITDTGIEIKIPIDQIQFYDNIEFSKEPGGPHSIKIDNIEQLKFK